MIFTSRSRMSNVFSLVAFVTVIGSLLFLASGGNIFHAQAAKAASDQEPFCVQKQICADAIDSGEYYTGHDEPSALFYSNTPGSGNSYISQLTLPKDPPTLPNQSGTGGTFNFQLHPAFWFGMAMCDDESAPNPGGSPLAGANAPCTPDSDANIYTGLTPGAPDYIGKHPGTAFMEMQFYPPGWILWPP